MWRPAWSSAAPTPGSPTASPLSRPYSTNCSGMMRSRSRPPDYWNAHQHQRPPRDNRGGFFRVGSKGRSCYTGYFAGDAYAIRRSTAVPHTPIPRTPSAYDYPLLIKNLLFCPVVDAPDQEIVYRGTFRYTYRDLRQRVRRLANALVAQGVKAGDTVAVMDWDSHRYLECFFAVPMIGAVLHTINVRLSPEQILYTIDHAEDDLLLVNSEFLPILEQIRGRMDTVRSFVLLNDEPSPPVTTISFAGEYEELIAASSAEFEFKDFDENIRATTFYTTGTTGMPKGVYFSQRQLVLHTLGVL